MNTNTRLAHASRLRRAAKSLIAQGQTAKAMEFISYSALRGSDLAEGVCALTARRNNLVRGVLPAGFSSTIRGENSGINGGLPYLLALPPPA